MRVVKSLFRDFVDCDEAASDYTYLFIPFNFVILFNYSYAANLGG